MAKKGLGLLLMAGPKGKKDSDLDDDEQETKEFVSSAKKKAKGKALIKALSDEDPKAVSEAVFELISCYEDYDGGSDEDDDDGEDY